MLKHEPTYHHAKGRVTLTCACGFVRRYQSEDVARRAYASHERDRRPKEKEVAA